MRFLKKNHVHPKKENWNVSKQIMFVIFLLPVLVIGQNTAPYGVFETANLVPNPTQVTQFEKGITEHNKKFHGEGPYGVRVYWVTNGPNTGSYHWSMGPFPWSSLDNRPAQKEGHEADWNKNVAPYMTPTSGAQSYWRSHSDLSRFSKDFTIKNMLVDYYDIKRGHYEDIMKLVKKINKVYAEKSPDDVYGIYTNEFASTKEGRDLAVISFFDKSAWLGENHDISKKYDEVYGAGSWKQFLTDFMAATNGGETEVWIYRPDLSGISGDVKVAVKQ